MMNFFYKSNVIIFNFFEAPPVSVPYYNNITVGISATEPTTTNQTIFTTTNQTIFTATNQTENNLMRPENMSSLTDVYWFIDNDDEAMEALLSSIGLDQTSIRNFVFIS